MKQLLIESQYLPPISYFSLLSGYETVVVEKFEHYVKQTYRNRCYINTSQGVVTLIIPLTSKHGKVLIKDVRIDHTQKWLNLHWRAIQSAYGKAPFFEFYGPDLHDILFQKHAFLYDLNFNLLTMCLRWLKHNISVAETSVYEKAVPQSVSDYRSLISPKNPESCMTFFKSVGYQQVFGSKFVNNLSIVDLVFCEGPGAMSIVRASASVNK